MRLFLVSALSFFVFALAVASEYTNDKYVYELNARNFEKVVHRSNYTTIVKFYAPWCGYCQRLAPIYLKLGKFIQGESKYAINVAAVDCDQNDNKGLCSQYQIEGFPTIMVFRPPKYDDDSKAKSKKAARHAVEKYNGERTLSAMWQFLQGRIKNYVTKFSGFQSDHFEKWLLNEKLAGYKKAVLLTQSKHLSPMFKSLAIDFHSTYRFGSITVKEKETQEGLSIFGYEVPLGLQLPVVLVFDSDTKEFSHLEVQSKAKKSENIQISEWLVKQNGNKLPIEGPLSLKEQKFYSKYRTGKASYKAAPIDDEL